MHEYAGPCSVVELACVQVEAGVMRPALAKRQCIAGRYEIDRLGGGGSEKKLDISTFAGLRYMRFA